MKGIADFTRGPVTKQLICFALPLFASQLLQILYNMADMVIVGQVMGKVGLSAVAIGGLCFFGCAGRSGMNALINGSGNTKVNFATAIFDGLVLRLGLSVLFGLYLNWAYLGFWLGDALANFTPLWVGAAFYASGKWKERRL